ncbi:MAG TPA: sugar ABC transporter ATP-binding protein [Candidatus Pullichristensenella stercorigallinarum]|uniref:Sugar ABC transporter ATP-binding protein n=1 Tax=Candidatus Pullichristensenella stercorigallinarum TaxID=2840909 RepID=A0A9D0ZN95_9FIRM|nr:sugar ABC transporter ATP-binding protein [Candidatus Pullichristensenella stercorigallinarum]
MSEYFLEIKNVSKAFQAVQALDHVNLKLRPGEIKCLAGENGCGKSTLIKIISGVYTPDEGEIIIKGKSHKALTPTESIAAGVQVIYQDFSLFPNLTVAENITMSYNLFHKNKAVNAKRNREMAAKIVEEIGVPLNLNSEVRTLSVGEKQVVAICRALLLDAELIIMDEPTSALTSKEVQALYKIIAGLKKKGIALIFVSHKLDEVLTIAETLSIMRDGKNVIDGPKEEFDKEKISYYMTGREVVFTPFQPKQIGDVILRVENMSLEPHYKDISFELRRGEVLGITGLLGSGRTELAESIFGLRKMDSGKITLFGKEIHINGGYSAVNAGIGYLPEDRLTQGLFLNVEIERNISAGILRKFSQRLFGVIDKSGMHAEVVHRVEDLGIKLGKLSDPVSSLSGGNQQRVVLAKWLAIHPKVLMLNCPTVGVDVGSKQNIHETIKRLANEGIGMIVISDDLPEILSVCNRILVMNKGSFTGEYMTTQLDENKLQSMLAKA